MGKAARRKKQHTATLTLDLEPSPDKLSTRLGDLVAPHVAAPETLDSYKALIVLGAMAWNLSLLPAGERAGRVANIVRDANKIGLPLTVEWMNALIDRKRSLFPSDGRFIENWDVRMQPDGKFTVFVIASLELERRRPAGWPGGVPPPKSGNIFRPLEEGGQARDAGMSWTIEIAAGPIAERDEEAWEQLEALREAEDERESGKTPSPALAELYRRLSARYPCIVEDLSSPWSDGPLINNFGEKLATLGIVSTRLGDALPEIVEIATGMDFTVFDAADETIHRPQAWIRPAERSHAPPPAHVPWWKFWAR